MKVWEYDWEIGWYETYKEWVTLEIATFKPTKIDDLEYYT